MKISQFSAIAAVTVASGFSSPAQAENERDIEIAALPPVVASAARRSVEGIQLVEAEEITTLTGFMYEVEGKLGRDEYEILITPQGEVVMVVLDD